MTPIQDQNDELLRRYLLGDLSEDEQRALERQLMTDQELFDRLLQAEEELIDQYARRGIRFEEQQAFERRFLQNPGRREDVQFAQALQRYLKKQHDQSDHEYQQNRTIFITPRWRAAMEIGVICAALVLAVVTFSLFREVRKLRERVAESQRERQAAELQSSELGQQIKSEAQQLQEVQQNTAILNAQNSNGEDLPALILWPDLTRNQNQVSTANLSSKTQKIRLELLLENASYPSYRAELQTVEGAVVWSRDSLIPHPGQRGRQAVTLLLPSTLLVRSDYLVRLSGMKGATVNTLASYYFKVIRNANTHP